MILQKKLDIANVQPNNIKVKLHIEGHHSLWVLLCYCDTVQISLILIFRY